MFDILLANDVSSHKNEPITAYVDVASAATRDEKFKLIEGGSLQQQKSKNNSQEETQQRSPTDTPMLPQHESTCTADNTFAEKCTRYEYLATYIKTMQLTCSH